VDVGEGAGSCGAVAAGLTLPPCGLFGELCAPAWVWFEGGEGADRGAP
jgi:hypothetical protein